MSNAQGLTELLKEMAVAADAGQRLADYLALLRKWNLHVNLTASTEWQALEPMFREAIWAARLYPADAIAHLDIGSGAGFPALLLKIMHPQVELEMVESRAKKCQFLETAAHLLKLQNVRVHAARLSDYLEQCGEDKVWDCISWKALIMRADDLLRLYGHRRRNTQFWMFHGHEAAWEETGDTRRRFALVRKVNIPGRREASLSIYRAGGHALEP